MNESYHPSPELLAAFVDGRLAGEARAEVVTHLDRCRDCYEVFAGTVRFQRQEEPRGRVLRPARFGAPQWVWWTAAAAAVLVVAIVVPVVWEDLGLDGEEEVLLLTADLAEALRTGGAGAPAAAWGGWPDTGLGFEEPLDRERASFRAGVWLMDLAAAARTQELSWASRALDDLARLFAAAGVAGELEGSLDAAREAVEDEDAEVLGRTVAELEAGAESALDSFYLAFGKWAEAGRLAAGSGDVELLRSPPFSKFGQRLGKRDLGEPVAETLGTVDELLRRASAQDGELDELAAQFDILIGRAG